MKILIVFLLTYCPIDTNLLIERVINDFDLHSCFLSFKIKNNTYIIENDDLYYQYFYIEKKYNKRHYKRKIRKVFKKNSVLDIDTIIPNFIQVPHIESVENNANKGVDEFIKIYFNGNVIKKEVTSDEEIVIIQKLFEWKIACKRDCETGVIYFSEGNEDELPYEEY